MDFDGVNQGQAPIRAYCDFNANVTIIGDTLEVEIEHCQSSDDCFAYEVNGYDSVMLAQIQALTKESSECYQEVEFNCLSAPLVTAVSRKHYLLYKVKHLPSLFIFCLFWIFLQLSQKKMPKH